MPIRFICGNPACGKRLRVKNDLAGKRVKCPGCGHSQAVPAPRAPAEKTAEAPSLPERFFGARAEEARQQGQPVSNPAVENPLSLQLLFGTPVKLESAPLTRTLRAYHPDLSRGTFEIEDEAAEQGTPFGLAGWGKHAVRIIGFDLPMPSKVVEHCVQPAHYGQALKKQARDHKGHALLYYGGEEEDTLEQYVALAAVAGTLASHGALVVLNESARTSFPAAALAAGSVEGDMLAQLRSLPLLALYCGFVKYDVEGIDGVWMRSYGAHLFGLPDLAFLAEDHNQGQMVFDIMNNILNYLRDSGARFDEGHTMQVGPDVFMRLRVREEEEYFLDSEGELFVMEQIPESDVNPGRGRR